MLKSFSSFFPGVLILLQFGLSMSVAHAQASEVPLTEDASMTADWPEWRWTILAGDDALKSGLPGMAEDLYREVLQLEIPSDAERSVKLKLVSALIAERSFSQADQLLDEVSSQARADYRLRRAIVAFNTDRMDEARSALSGINPRTLSRSERPWYYLILGLLDKLDALNDSSARWIERAMETSVSPAQRAQFETLLLTTRVAESNNDSDFIDRLRRKADENRGTRPGFAYAREYAVALDRSNQKSEAIGILQDQLTLIAPDEPDEKAQTLLLIGLIAGRDARRGQLAFEEILREGSEPGIQRVALYLVAGVERDDEQEALFREFLNGLIEDPNNPIRDEILVLRSRLRLAVGDLNGAATDAERLLAEFPASNFSDQARWILAYMAWQEKRFRTAADFLQQIREKMPPSYERQFLGQLVGDCYFLNGDFATAAEIYEGVLQNAPTDFSHSGIAYQSVMAQIQTGELDQAGETLDRLATEGQIDSDRLWRAEWNLVEALRQADKTIEAFTRLSLKLQATPLNSLKPEFRLRLMWLAAFLSYDAGEYESVPPVVSEALESIEIGEGASLPDAEKRMLASSLILLEGQAQLRSGDEAAGIATLELVRQEYPNTDSAVLSYLVESRYLAAEYRLAEAQRRLSEMADRYQDNAQAPIALLEAAMMAEKQGQDRNFEEAIGILKVLLERYPDNEMVFHAKLQLGNLTRKLNQFGAAQVVYENILQDYAGSGKAFPLYLAQLYRADSLLALSGGDVTRLDSAAEGFDQVLDDPDAPLDARIEAGYKQALISVRQGNLSRARETIWLMVTRYLKDPQVEALFGPRERYWMSRSLLELGRILEESGEVREAKEVYRLIEAYNLPGKAIAEDKLQPTPLN